MPVIYWTPEKGGFAPNVPHTLMGTRKLSEDAAPLTWSLNLVPGANVVAPPQIESLRSHKDLDWYINNESIVIDESEENEALEARASINLEPLASAPVKKKRTTAQSGTTGSVTDVTT